MGKRHSNLISRNGSKENLDLGDLLVWGSASCSYPMKIQQSDGLTPGV
jgi:hypothetical protein